jgi:hypothetical protein
MRFVLRRLRHSRALVLAGAAIAALVLTATAAAGLDRYKLRQTTTGTAAARAVMLQKVDLGSPSDWKGGPVKPDISTMPGCPNFHPKHSDLVLAGAAAVSYVNAGVTMRSDSEVFATAKMLRLDWQRTVRSPHFLACLRAHARKNWTGKNRFVSLRPLVFPESTPGTTAFRLVLKVTRNGNSVLVALDTIALARGKTEVALSTIMPLAGVPTLFPNELVVFKALAGRVPA